MEQHRPIFIVKQDAPWEPNITIRFGIRDSNGLAVAMPVEMRRVPEGEAAPSEPMLTLWHDDWGMAALQSLMDQLWQFGVRPSDVGTPGHLEATKIHLSDMRKLVAKTYGVEL